MNESNYPTLMHVENINSLKSLLFDKDAEGFHLFCSFNLEELNPGIINKLQHSQFNSISFNNAKTIYPDGPEPMKGHPLRGSEVSGLGRNVSCLIRFVSGAIRRLESFGLLTYKRQWNSAGYDQVEAINAQV